MRTSELAVLVIGTINIILLFIAASTTSSGNIKGLGSVFLLFVHIIIIIGAFPILVRAIFGNHTISKNFTIIFTTIALLSALLVLLTSSATSSSEDDSFFVFIGIIELIPILFLYIKRGNIIWQKPQKLPFE